MQPEMKPVTDAPPLPFTVYPKKVKVMWLLLVSIAFVVIGILMICDGQVKGWLVCVFSGIITLVGLIQLIPVSSFLTVDEDGFEYCALFRRHRFSWSVISGSGTYSIRHGFVSNTFVGFNFLEGCGSSPRGSTASKALVGFEAGLPDTYGYRAEVLARWLAFYRTKKLAGS